MDWPVFLDMMVRVFLGMFILGSIALAVGYVMDRNCKDWE